MAIKKYFKKDGACSYQAIYRTSGQQHRKTFENKREAEDFLCQVLTSRNGADSPNPSPLTFLELVELWDSVHAKVNLQESSRIRLRQHLKHYILPIFAEIDTAEISSAFVSKWFSNLVRANSLSGKTLNCCLGTLKGIFSFAMNNGFVSKNPTSFVKPLKVTLSSIDFLTAEEINQFLQCNVGFYYSDLYVLAFNTGMRLGELLGLKFDCVDFRYNTLTIKRIYCSHTKRIKETTKSSKIRVIPMNGPALSTLRKLKLASQRELVFCDTKGQVVDASHFTANNLINACKRAGIRRIRFHTIRHSYASHFMQNGGNIYDLQKILGHSTILMTEKYTHFSPNYLAGAANVVSFSVEEKDGKLLKLTQSGIRGVIKL